jgi:hypothetical protein
MLLSAGELATLSLLDPDQGMCPNGHLCQLDDRVGYRRCGTCEYSGLALICWDVTRAGIRATERAGAAPRVIDWALAFIADRRDEI